MVNQTRREFLKLGLAAAGSALVASGIEIPLLGNQNSALKTQLTNLQNRVNTVVGFLSLSITEQSLLEKIVETIIPTDSDPGAKEAGVIYFIDRALAGDYGQSANMFMDSPHILPGIPASLTNTLSVAPSLAWATNPNIPGASIAPIIYTGGDVGNQGSGAGITAKPRVGSGINYQYPLNMREFWRVGLDALQKFAKDPNGAYKGAFESLSATNQLLVLQDIWGNKPASFNNITPKDFAYELTFMTWAGFLMDPIYGGNQNMVGWKFTGFNGVNFGNFYGEGQDQKTLMVATSPTRLQPASLAQYQRQASGGS